jgi:diguanylate cyclase (GGDEF)-like protein
MNSMLVLASFAFAMCAIAWGMQSQREASKAKAYALLDPLTGVFNRRGWETIVEREAARSAREGTPMTVFLMDINDFKLVNDRSGHAAGDAVLTAIARAISSVARKHDVVARLGGDEFSLLAVDDGTNALPETLAQRLAAAFQPIGVTVSIGYAVVAAGGEIEHALTIADQVMYASKLAFHGQRHASGLRKQNATAHVPTA